MPFIDVIDPTEASGDVRLMYDIEINQNGFLN